MQKEVPFVSVLMTAYNRENFIAEAIESVLTSSYTNFELVIVDDCSTDKTFEIIQYFAIKDQRIRYYQNEKNLGDYPNRNRAASYAKGYYITYLDSDDKLLIEGLKNCIEAMLQFPEAGVGMYWSYSKGPAFCLNGAEAIRQHFFQRQLLVIGPGGTVLKRSFFEHIRGYPEKYGPANDMYFNLKAACNSELVLFPFAFSFYRIHDAQENKNEFSYLYNNYLYQKDALNELSLPFSLEEKEWLANKNKRRFLVNIVKYFFKTRDPKHLLRAISLTNYSLKALMNALFP